MASPDDIRSALNARLASLGLANIAWANKAFADPTASWVRPTFLPGQPYGRELGNGAGSERYVGLYQVDCFAPLEGGDGVARDLAAVVLAGFAKGLALSYNGTPVGIARSYTYDGGARDSETPYYRIIVRIEYYASI